MQLISSKTVILKVVRDLGLGNMEIPWQDFMEWIAEGLQHIGAYGQFVEAEAELEVQGYRAKLPDDFFSARSNNHITYKRQGDTIIVGFEEGLITSFKYLAFAVDDEGFPLVPDNVSYATALFWKVAMQLAIRDELPNKKLDYATCVARWNWYCRQAGSQGAGMGSEMAHRYASLFNSRIPILTSYNQSFNVVNGEVEPLAPEATINVIPKHWTPTPDAG